MREIITLPILWHLTYIVSIYLYMHRKSKDYSLFAQFELIIATRDNLLQEITYMLIDYFSEMTVVSYTNAP